MLPVGNGKQSLCLDEKLIKAAKTASGNPSIGIAGSHHIWSCWDITQLSQLQGKSTELQPLKRLTRVEWMSRHVCALSVNTS